MVLAFVMSKQARRRRRRGARRNVEDVSAEPTLDSIVDLIFDSKIDGGAFAMPWRSGANAARVLLRFLGESIPAKSPWLMGDVFSRMMLVQTKIENKPSPPDLVDAYELAGGIANDAQHLSAFADRFGAYARLVRLFASNSHGGGHAYNVILQPIADAIAVDEEPCFSHAVKLARSFDAIGTSYMLANDPHDRVREAFRVLWDGGHYRAIYALPHLSLEVTS